MSDNFILSVSSLNRYIKSVIEEDNNLQNVFVRGEISGFKNHWQSGHYYFTLKDEKSEIRCAMFRNANQRLRFMPEDSLSVICRGRIGLYDAKGDISFYVDDMQPDGIGALSIAFEQLKKRLEAEGLFDSEHKKELPVHPKKIGVVTSESGAAIQDIINVISRRYPLAEIIICNASVQGTDSAEEIAHGINLFNKLKAADVLIVGRGGGSMEDLWSFNEEIVARAIYNSEIPVVSAVGHETDFTIADFVADMRAPTPSAAAELVVPDSYALRDSIESMQNRLRLTTNSRIHTLASTLNLMKSRVEKFSPRGYIENLEIRNDAVLQSLNSVIASRISLLDKNLEHQIFRLDAFNPLKILSRGYSIASLNGRVLTDKSDVVAGEVINVRFENNSIDCEVL